MIGDTEALQFHVAEPGAQFRSLPLRIQSGQDNQYAHQPYDQCERGGPHLDAKIHRRAPSNLAEERTGWPQETAAPVKPRLEHIEITACTIHAHGKTQTSANFS
jgi:hypothetical protein